MARSRTFLGHVSPLTPRRKLLSGLSPCFSPPVKPLFPSLLPLRDRNLEAGGIPTSLSPTPGRHCALCPMVVTLAPMERMRVRCVMADTGSLPFHLIVSLWAFSHQILGEVNTQYFSVAKIVRSFLVRSVTPPPANRLFPIIFLFFIVPHKKRVFPVFSLPASLLLIFWGTVKIDCLTSKISMI